MRERFWHWLEEEPKGWKEILNLVIIFIFACYSWTAIGRDIFTFFGFKFSPPGSITKVISLKSLIPLYFVGGLHRRNCLSFSVVCCLRCDQVEDSSSGKCGNYFPNFWLHSRRSDKHSAPGRFGIASQLFVFESRSPA